MAVFRTADEALEFAMSLQTDTGDERIRIRAGIHVGTVRLVGDREITGSVVDYTARLVGWSQEDSIVLSNMVKELIDAELGETRGGVEFKRYTCSLTGWPGKQAVWRALKPEEVEEQ